MSESDYIDLNRLFLDSRDSEFAHGELDDPGILEYLGELGVGSTIGWSGLLEKQRVVLLAEAGAGKSREMSEQARRLVEEGRYGFFVPLERLENRQLAGCLDMQCRQRFEKWKADGHDPGWFFLDSVDELKLKKRHTRKGTIAVLG